MTMKKNTKILWLSKDQFVRLQAMVTSQLKLVDRDVAKFSILMMGQKLSILNNIQRIVKMIF